MTQTVWMLHKMSGMNFRNKEDIENKENSVSKFFQSLMPFIFLGIVLVLFVAGIILLSYLLITGAVVGILLFLIAWLREKFLSSRRSPRIIEHKKD